MLPSYSIAYTAQALFTTELSFSDKTGPSLGPFLAPLSYMFSSDHNPCLLDIHLSSLHFFKMFFKKIF